MSIRVPTLDVSSVDHEPGDARLDWARCRVLWDQGRRDEVLDLARDHARSCDGTSSLFADRIVVRAAWIAALECQEDPTLSPALECIRKRVAEQQGPAPLVADLAHLDAYRGLMQSTDLRAALRDAALAAEVYGFLGEASSEVKARILLVRIDAIAGRLQSSLANARAALARAESTVNAGLIAQAHNALGTALFRRGEWSEAETCFHRCESMASSLDDARWVAAARAQLIRLRVAQGEVTAAASLLETIDPQGVEAHASATRGVFDEYRGMVLAASGDVVGALSVYRDAVDRIELAGVVSYERSELRLRIAEAELLLGHPGRALSEATRGLEEVESTGQWLDRGQLLRAQASALAQLGQSRASAEALDRAEGASRKLGDRHGLARCLLDRALDSTGRSERRRAAAVEAMHLFSLIGLADEAERAADVEVSIEASLVGESATLAREGVDSGGLVAASASMQKLLVELTTAAASDGPTLLQGETGTGKEVLARCLHDRSSRASAAFVPVNCAAIPESLFEREFFGHVRGAFTGADRGGTGLVEAADGGTLFLDEIGEMPLAMQPKLLRLLQEGTFRRVGDVVERRADLRIVAASNRPLFELAQRGEFREDLYYRLSWFELAIAPLRERPEDVLALLHTFLGRAKERNGRSFGYTRSALRAIQRYEWPGNVRQLESAIASACARAGSDGTIRTADLPAPVRSRAKVSALATRARFDLQSELRCREREVILEALDRAAQRRTEAARLLGIGRNTLYEKMKRLGISADVTLRAS